MQRIDKLADFGSMIQKRRKQLHINQESLSMMTGVPQSNLSKIERGQISVQLETCLKLTEALGIDLMGEARDEA